MTATTANANGDLAKIEANGFGYNEPNLEQKGNFHTSIARPVRDDRPFMADIFPNTTEGRLLKGITRSFLIKQEPRMGWARKSACDEKKLLPHPCESVASHQWGVGFLCNVISKTAEFQRELPDFNPAIAYEMASLHDLAELVTGDITPVEGVTSEQKHHLESKAMDSILSFYPDDVTQDLKKVYNRYEDRQCIESKFIKDCDKLDFMINAFVLERQKFRGFDEFYTNSNKGFFTKIAQRLADELIATRARLIRENAL